MLRPRSLSSSAFGLREILLDAGEAFYALHKRQVLLGRPEPQVLFHELALLDALLDLLLEPQVRCSDLL
jgi:hypothetical protein